VGRPAYVVGQWTKVNRALISSINGQDVSYLAVLRASCSALLKVNWCFPKSCK